jgi:hypothetical protein
MSLIHLIFYGIDNEGLIVYDPDVDVDEFKVPMAKDKIDRKMGVVAKKQQVQDTLGNMVEKDIMGSRRYDEVKKVLIKEKWFFDRNYSTMQVRILGLCPIRVYPREIKVADNAAPTTDNEETAEMECKRFAGCIIPKPEICYPVIRYITDIMMHNRHLLTICLCSAGLAVTFTQNRTYITTVWFRNTQLASKPCWKVNA